MRALILAPFEQTSLERLRGVADVVYESWLETNRLQDPDELGARLAREHIDVLVVEADFVFEEVFEAAPDLRLVGVCRNALNQVDLEAAAVHGVAVTHAPGRNTNAVAEMTLALMLALSRRIVSAHGLVSGGGWRDPAAGYRQFRGREIGGSTIGVVGFGQIGREVARKCIALGASVLAYDPLVPAAHMRELHVEPASLSDVARASDFVTLHVPETEATHRLVDASLLSQLKADAYLVNTSGGSVIDVNALVRALETHQIAGAACDVFEGHPLPASSPLMSAPNLLLTPHIGGATAETIARHSMMLTDEVERFAAGEPLRYAVVQAADATRAG
ncbi:MAG TPA: NAD(P)-dependent oxidoreductase [Dehalococcoidia bacterium]